MSDTADMLTTTVQSILESINNTLECLEKTTDTSEKTQLAAVVKALAESQKFLVESLDIDDDLGFDFGDPDFDDDFFGDTDEGLNPLLDTKQIQFTRKDGKKKKGKKQKDDDTQPGDED